MSDIRVFIAEDHKTVRAGLKMLIDAESDMQVVGEAGDGREAVHLAEKIRPDVLVMDISMPELNGLVATAKLKRIAPEIAILTLTRHTDRAYLQELMQAGVSGYVLKQSDSDEMLRAIRTVASGGKYLDPAITGNVFNIFSTNKTKQRGEIAGEPLSGRETDVLHRIARGYSNKEIADQLGTSVKTVETQKANALRKLSIKGRNEIVEYAVLQGWLQDH